VESRDHRDHRNHRLASAWLTLLPSKAVTFLVQAIAVPLVYRALGPAQFAAYAAVTAAVSILGFLNLGMGGALVTPLTQAAAARDHGREATLLGATLIPLAGVAALALMIVLPLLGWLPLDLLFGLAAATTPPGALRASALLACIGTLAAVPLSVTESARQAYQEIHISNLFGLLTNVLLCTGLLLAGSWAPTLPVFVAVTALSPLAVRLVSATCLFTSRPYLLPALRRWGAWRLADRLAGDGFSYLGAAAIAGVLLYQWPVYYVARVRPAAESAAFAVYMQAILLTLSFGVSLAQPLWPAVADAAALGDRAWLHRVIRRAQAAALGYGALELLAFGLFLETLLRLWLRKPVPIPAAAGWLAGSYLLLATWEYVHWPLALGLGAMRPASGVVFWRAVAFAVSVPFVISYGPSGLMIALCASILAITAWFYPVLLERTAHARRREFAVQETA
jgi:O-antigen/teichoic acid export membrane protein